MKAWYIHTIGCYSRFENYVIETFNYVVKLLIQHVWPGQSILPIDCSAWFSDWLTKKARTGRPSARVIKNVKKEAFPFQWHCWLYNFGADRRLLNKDNPEDNQWVSDEYTKTTFLQNLYLDVLENLWGGRGPLNPGLYVKKN